MRKEKIFKNFGKNLRKYWKIFKIIYEILQKFGKNYEISDLSELWMDVEGIVKKNLENFEYPLLQILKN